MPNEPSQLPKQQFAVSNADTRSQTRLSKLEERVRQLEQGKQLAQTPLFKWQQSSDVVGTTNHTFSIPLPAPFGDADFAGYEQVFYCFSVILSPNGGTFTGTAMATIFNSQSWTFTAGGSLYGPSTGAALADIGAAGKASLIASPLFYSGSDAPSYSTLDLNFLRTGGTAGSTVTIQSASVYVIIPTTFPTRL
jgi:hypothetical protein